LFAKISAIYYASQATNQKRRYKLNIDELRAKLKHMNLASVARATGMTRHQVAGVANGTTRRPDYDVVKTLIEFFEGE